MTPELKNKKESGLKNKQKKSDIKISTKKNSTDFSEKEVSVITKTTKPQVLIQTERINNYQKDPIYNWAWLRNKSQLIKFCCSIIICIIILLTFFLSLKTYNMVKDLHEIIF